MAESTTNPIAACNNIYQVTGIAGMLANHKKQATGDRLVQRALATTQQHCTRQNGMNYYDAIISYYSGHGFIDEAKRLTDAWEENTIALRGADSPTIEWILRKRAEIARIDQNEPEATAFDEELLKRSEANHGADSQETTQQRMHLARLAIMRQDFGRAEELWRKALPAIERMWNGTQMHASALGQIADSYAQAQRFDEALRYAQRAVEVAREAEDGQPQYFQERLATIQRQAAEEKAHSNADRFNGRISIE